MIGEMRDKETADIAIEASLTGHLVLSTLHTNSAVETVTRLLDLGCDPFNFADAMLGVLAQRLCKRLCSHCKEPYAPSEQEVMELSAGYGSSVDNREPPTGLDANTLLFRPKGCEGCRWAGFSGRVALHEFLEGSGQIKGLIQARSRTSELLAGARQGGMLTLVQDGIEKVLKGFTTYPQVRAVALA
jgi:type II secretory ATPase GspE/PulE/Tfp pilus assembly ATPase PilB-like protein